MSTNPPGGGSPTQPTIFLQGPQIERKELFKGRASHITQIKLHAIGGLLCVGGFVLAIFLFVFASITLVWILGIVMSLAGAAMIFWGWVKVMSVNYRVDTLRVEVERGLLRRRIDNLELWRVKDIQFRQGLVQRMLGVGDVVLVSTDATNPMIELHGVPAPRALYDALRDAVDANRRGRGILGVEQS